MHTWDRSRDAERSFRLDRMRSAQLTQERFEPRTAFDPHGFRDGRSAKILYLKGVAARWAAERGATPLKDGTALAEMPVGSVEWLIGEVLSQRGEAILLEPEEMREAVADRARELGERARRLASPPRLTRRAADMSLLDLRTAHSACSRNSSSSLARKGSGKRKVGERLLCSRARRAHCGAGSARHS